ncbi:MAG: thiamine diphosphokinase [Acidimicrobiia bacterium]
MTSTILILTGGGPAPTTPLPDADIVIAADSGLGLAAALAVHVDLVVGDLDSVDRSQLDTAITDGAAVEEHPTNKDATDLDLALQAAVDRGATRIVLAGGGAGRIDHLLGIAMLLTDERWADAAIEWHSGSSITHVVSGALALDTQPDDLVSLIPVSDEAVVSITGTRWPLEFIPLPRGTTHGISNEALGGSVDVEVHQGVVLAVITRGE